MTFIITIIAVLLVVGSLIAVLWWRLSAKIAPYGDESARARARAEERRRELEANTVVIDSSDDDRLLTRRMSSDQSSVVQAATYGAAAGMLHEQLNAGTEPASRPTDVPGTQYSGPDADTTGFGGGGSGGASYDGESSSDAGGSSDSSSCA